MTLESVKAVIKVCKRVW